MVTVMRLQARPQEGIQGMRVNTAQPLTLTAGGARKAGGAVHRDQ